MRRQRQALESGIFSCTNCDQKFGSSRELRAHEENHVTGPTKDISTSDSTDKKFNQKGRKRIAEENHVSGPTKDVSTSDSTDKKLNQKERKRIREKEMRRRAIQSGIFSCSHCAKKFGKSSDLKRHEQIHVEGANKEVSKEVLEERRMKAKQRRIEVLESGAISCCHCGKRFRDTRELDRHEKLHTGERPFMCCICGKAFIDAPRLKRHEINHINDKRELVAKDENM